MKKKYKSHPPENRARDALERTYKTKTTHACETSSESDFLKININKFIFNFFFLILLNKLNVNSLKK